MKSVYNARPIHASSLNMTNEQLSSTPLDAAAVTQYIIDTFASVETTDAMGYTFFFYGAERKMPFATIAHEDNEYDSASQLHRPGVFRLNIGVRKETYRALFGPHPAASENPKGVVATGHDFAAINQLMPHPVYAPQSWVCILTPSPETFRNTVQPLLAEAYAIALERQARREERG